MSARVVLSTFPSPDLAASVSRTLVGEGLAACVNLVPGVRSIYRWDGQVQDDGEVLAVIKTHSEALAGLEARLVELHPYDCPEFIALDVAGGSAAYLAWLDASMSRP